MLPFNCTAYPPAVPALPDGNQAGANRMDQAPDRAIPGPLPRTLIPPGKAETMPEYGGFRRLFGAIAHRRAGGGEPHIRMTGQKGLPDAPLGILGHHCGRRPITANVWSCSDPGYRSRIG
jgi:hypothetical protein